MTYERASIRRLAGYEYGEQPDDPEVVKLNTNESPYPPSPRVAAALAAFDAAALRRYPSPDARAFRELVAKRWQLAPEQVLATNGGDEALRLAITTFADPGATFAMATPSYSLCAVLAQVQGCRIEAVPMADDWTLPPDFAAIANAQGAPLACIVNPHAPSGSLTAVDALAQLAEDIRGVLLIDEAYVDFVDPSRRHDATSLLREFDNVLLLRTLSKGYALAGLRFGFLLGAAALLDPIARKTRDSYNTGAIAQRLACAAFADEAHAQGIWRAVRAERERLRQALTRLGFAVAPSQTNFLLADAGRNARPIYEGLRERGVLVRHFNAGRLAAALRITVGSPQQNEALLAALAALMA